MPKAKAKKIKKTKLGSATVIFELKGVSQQFVIELQSLHMKQGVRMKPGMSDSPGFPDFEVDDTIEISMSGHISKRGE